MKKYILILAFILLLPACDDEIDETMKNIVMDLIDNPDKLRDIPKYYPQYYNSEYFHVFNKDTVYINKLICFLKNDYNKIKSRVRIYRVGDDKRYFDDLGIKYNFDSVQMFSYTFVKENDCFDITFLKKDTNLYIFYYRKDIFDSHYGGKEE